MTNQEFAMPTYEFEAMDATGQEIRDVIDAPSEEEAQTTIRQMGYFVTKITVKKTKGRGRRPRRRRRNAVGDRRRRHQV
jgi:type IV pilus assembly protein PilC